MARNCRTIWGDHQRYKETYFTAFPGKYFTGDGLYDEVGYYRITGRVDDVVIVLGHNTRNHSTKMLLTSIRQLLSQQCRFPSYQRECIMAVILKRNRRSHDRENLIKEIASF
jgi:acetyl-CoA synthetase